MIKRRLAPGLRAPACLTALVVAALAPGCRRTTPEAQLVDEAVGALGGRAAVEAAGTLTIEGEGEAFVLGQGRTPDATLKLQVTELKRVTDFAQGRFRQEQLLTPQFLRNDPRPEREVLGLDGPVAFDVAEGGSVSRQGDAVARDRRAELFHSPLGILRAAIAPGAVLSDRRRVGDHEVVNVRPAEGGLYTLTLDGATKLPLKVSSSTDHENLGDVVVETEFGGYEQAGPLKLPTFITARLERDTLFTTRVTKNLVGAPTGDLTAPASARSAPSAPPPPGVKVEELAPGVWLLSGYRAHSVLVEFADHLTLIEAPTDDARTLAVIAKARELRPSKPLTQAVITHHHFDHIGGVRAAVSEGLTLVAHEQNAPYLESMVSRPHTIAPDALSKRPRPLKLQAVRGEATLEDATRTLRLYSAESRHASTMLVAHLPKERLLVEVDLYTSPPPNAPPLNYPHVPNLLEVVRSRSLSVDRVVPLHRETVPFADVIAAAPKAPPTAP